MRHSTMKAALTDFLDELCATHGYCLPPLKKEALLQQNQYTSEEFAYAILIAAGIIPQYQPKPLRHIQSEFKKHFGDSVSAKDFNN